MAALRQRQNKLLTRTAFGIVIAILVTACGTDTPPAPPLPAVQSPPRHTPTVASLPQEEQPIPAVYRSRERRDPFRPVKTASQSPTVRLTLTGIVREAHSYYALVESDSPPGMGYIIRENDVVDSAKVVKITKNSVVFEVKAKNPEGKLLTRYIEKHMQPVVSR